MKRITRITMTAVALAVSAGCGVLHRAGIGLFYQRVAIDPSRVHLDQPYVPGGNPKQRLDLFVPAVSLFPTVVFAHGGGWRDGDRALEVGGADVYRNIGRMFASHGIGAAIISYRLQPEVDWQRQVDDVAAATSWVYRNIATYGGRPDAIVLMGHSAGAQLAAHAAFDETRLQRAGVPRSALAGLIAVSGAGYDLADERTYALGNDPAYYAARFGGTPGWERTASPMTYVSRDDPPVLVMFATGETEPLKHQARLLHDRLIAAGVDSRLEGVKGYSHTRIVLALSRADKPAVPAMVAFVRASASR